MYNDNGGDPDEICLTVTDTGDVFKFQGFDVADKQKGLLKERTDYYGCESITYTFDPDSNLGVGRITSATTSQGWSVTYSYSGTADNTGRLKKIKVKNSSSQVIQRIKYTYKSSSDCYHNDTGTAGDLLMVEVLRRASRDNLSQSADSVFSIQHAVQYRFYRSGDSDGTDHAHVIVRRRLAVAYRRPGVFLGNGFLLVPGRFPHDSGVVLSRCRSARESAYASAGLNRYASGPRRRNGRTTA